MSDLTKEDLKKALLEVKDSMCPADKETYEKHCTFIDESIASQGERDKIIQDTASVLADVVNKLSLLSDRILILETEKKTAIAVVAFVGGAVGAIAGWAAKHL